MTVKELIADLSKYDGDLEVKPIHVTSDGMEDAQYKIAYIAEESLTNNLVITLYDDPTEQRPSECKHCNADGIHCDKHFEPAGENVWVYPCHLQEFPCPDFAQKK